ncbi:hypothetical protein [Pseudomonas sp.]|uniref:hypothetical protein n=1 Tax=Pseudomonas sp. TaxID=306 RepID=UPI0028B12B0B|nr:hypothetical protein [Pseudomonas sp.]
MRVPLLLLTLTATAAAFADGTGPTHPNKAREHPLDAREPRQEVIEHGDQADPPRPPTLESPPAVPPIEPSEQRQTRQPGLDDRRSADTPAR